MIQKSGLDLIIFHTDKDRIVNEQARTKLKHIAQALKDKYEIVKKGDI